MKWRLTDTDLCPCGETQTMSHIVESCPLTKLNGGLSRLQSADEDAVSWLTSYGSWHAYDKKNVSMVWQVCNFHQSSAIPLKQYKQYKHSDCRTMIVCHNGEVLDICDGRLRDWSSWYERANRVLIQLRVKLTAWSRLSSHSAPNWMLYVLSWAVSTVGTLHYRLSSASVSHSI